MTVRDRICVTVGAAPLPSCHLSFPIGGGGEVVTFWILMCIGNRQKMGTWALTEPCSQTEKNSLFYLISVGCFSVLFLPRRWHHDSVFPVFLSFTPLGYWECVKDAVETPGCLSGQVSRKQSVIWPLPTVPLRWWAASHIGSGSEGHPCISRFFLQVINIITLFFLRENNRYQLLGFRFFPSGLFLCIFSICFGHHTAYSCLHPTLL